VTVDTICASLCIYLLLGVCWSGIHVLAEVLEPGSFQLPGHGPDAQFVDFALYYSLVTMTTLGYGDVIPSSPSTRMFAATEAIMGQLYIAVLVARLVGLHIAQAASRSA
jgi:voltage-gated potassium channel Kch